MLLLVSLQWSDATGKKMKLDIDPSAFHDASRSLVSRRPSYQTVRFLYWSTSFILRGYWPVLLVNRLEDNKFSLTFSSAFSGSQCPISLLQKLFLTNLCLPRNSCPAAESSAFRFDENTSYVTWSNRGWWYTNPRYGFSEGLRQSTRIRLKELLDHPTLPVMVCFNGEIIHLCKNLIEFRGLWEWD